MTKKWTLLALILTLTIVLSACGNQQVEKNLTTSSTKDSSATYFEDSVFLGDSIIEGLSFHDMLDEKQVMGKAGATALFAQDDVDELVSRNPKKVYIQLGSDDILWPIDDPISFSMSNYATLIRQIREKLPNTEIIVLSVTPVTQEALQKEPRYKNIALYNQQLNELAQKELVKYIDVTPLFEESNDLYDTDGIHFTAQYYSIFLNYLKDYVS